MLKTMIWWYLKKNEVVVEAYLNNPNGRLKQNFLKI